MASVPITATRQDVRTSGSPGCWLGRVTPNTPPGSSSRREAGWPRSLLLSLSSTQALPVCISAGKPTGPGAAAPSSVGTYGPS